MKAELLARSPLLILPLGALFFFLFVFVYAVYQAMRTTGHDSLGALPLRDDNDEEGR